MVSFSFIDLSRKLVLMSWGHETSSVDQSKGVFRATCLTRFETCDTVKEYLYNGESLWITHPAARMLEISSFGRSTIVNRSRFSVLPSCDSTMHIANDDASGSPCGQKHSSADFALTRMTNWVTYDNKISRYECAVKRDGCDSDGLADGCPRQNLGNVEHV